MPGGEAGLAHRQLFGPEVEFRVERIRCLRNVGKKQLEGHLLAEERPFAVGGDLHPFFWKTAAGWRQHTLAFDLNHAGAAVAVRPHAFHITKAGNFDAVLLRGLQDGLIRIANYGSSVHHERDWFRRMMAIAAVLPVYSRQAVRNRRDRNCFQERRTLLVHDATSSEKYFKTQSAGFGAAWPRPQIDASTIACESSFNKGASHRFCSINWRALTVPTRHGVHWPQDSSEKNFIRFRAVPDAVSCVENTTMAADPMKQPYSFNVSKSSGMSALEAGRIPPQAPHGE